MRIRRRATACGRAPLSLLLGAAFSPGGEGNFPIAFWLQSQDRATPRHRPSPRMGNEAKTNPI